MVLSYATCDVSVASLRVEPSHRAEQSSQLLFGERVEILQLEKDHWAYVRSFHDEYEGWCLFRQLRTVTKKEFKKWPKYMVAAHSGRLVGEGFEMEVPMGASIRSGILQIGAHKVRFKGKKMEALDITPDRASVKNFSCSFLHAPYLWGGRSLQGIDCSGLSQLVLMMSGIAIARDASRQATQGQTIVFLQEALCGDLAFFGEPEGSINHVGILLDSEHIIHATETAGRVVVDKIDQEGIVSKVLRRRTHSLRTIKRFFEGS